MVSFFSLAIGGMLGTSVWFYLSWTESGIVRRQLRSALRPFETDEPRVLLTLWKRFQNRSPQKIAKYFPDFLDLLALGLSAGLSLDRAWSLTTAHLPAGPLSDDLKIFENSVKWGKQRAEAMKIFSMRLGDPQLRMTLALLEQAMKRGNHVQEALVDQARALRQRRFSEVEKFAQTASLRLLFPIFVFILPAVFLILFAPLVLTLSQGINAFF